MVTTEQFEFTLRKAEFCSKYHKYTSELDYLTAEDYNGLNEDGKVFLVFEFELKYIGKTQRDHTGYDRYYIGEGIKLEYNNDYIFEPTVYVAGEPSSTRYDIDWIYTYGTSINKTSFDLEPLNDTTYLARGFFEVAPEVKDNTSASLKLIFEGNVYNLRTINY